MPVCAMVCEAPRSRSSGGRSALSSNSGRPLASASTTAGSQLATALPEVQTSATGSPLAFAAPSAAKAATRSSWKVWT
jgi:hypothetical protein